jgi:hypothetical protein
VHTGVFIEKPEGRRPLGKPRRWGKNIKTNLQEVVLGELTGLIWFKTGAGGGVL